MTTTPAISNSAAVRRPSMTRRLVIYVTGVVLLAWLFASGLAVVAMQFEFAEIFDGAVQETADRLLPLAVDDLSDRNGGEMREISQPSSGDEYLTYQVRSADGQVIMHSHDVSEVPYPVPLKVGFADTPTHRIYTASTADGALFIQVADAFENRREAVREAGGALLYPLIALVPLSIIAVIFVVSRMLRPISGLRDEISMKDSGNMAPVKDDRLPRELEPIARSVNHLLERLRSALDAEREFASNSAHELRTPIAGALAQAQRLQAEIPAEHRNRVDQIETSLAHLARLAEKLLQMSRAEAGIGVSDAPTDLMPVLKMILLDFERLPGGEGRIRLHDEAAQTIIHAVNPDAFGIVMRNLVENALVHGPDDGPVDVVVASESEISVINGGPVIDPQVLTKLTTRFARGATSASGSGLGLSIVASLVPHMGGRLDLLSPATGRADGFEVRIRLGVAPDAVGVRAGASS